MRFRCYFPPWGAHRRDRRHLARMFGRFWSGDASPAINKAKSLQCRSLPIGKCGPGHAPSGQAVLTRKMPPWGATASAHAFRNDRRLSGDEIQTIVDWADAGAPEGEAIAPYVRPRRDDNWKLGKPDRVIRLPAFDVPKTGPLPYSFLIVPMHLTHDVWVRAAEFRVDQHAVIHHMNAFVRPPGSSFLEGFPTGQVFVPTVSERGRKRPGENVFDRRELLQGYEPGYEPMPWLTNGAKLIRAGSDVVFELHYNPNGKEVVDHSEFALYFAEQPPQQRVLAIDTLRDLDLAIPPNDGSYQSESAITLTQPVRLLSVQPHMHLRGKSMKSEYGESAAACGGFGRRAQIRLQPGRRLTFSKRRRCSPPARH